MTLNVKLKYSRVLCTSIRRKCVSKNRFLYRIYFDARINTVKIQKPQQMSLKLWSCNVFRLRAFGNNLLRIFVPKFTFKVGQCFAGFHSFGINNDCVTFTCSLQIAVIDDRK